ncbi:hypothetical protein ACIPN8_36445 [Streptomyces sp. NPDC086082]|uniref:hypothetical protein n=1 Tax=Streptomyces sp. NPDC086082 TaxID=3365750 RepID=UPI0037FDA589
MSVFVDGPDAADTWAVTAVRDRAVGGENADAVAGSHTDEEAHGRVQVITGAGNDGGGAVPGDSDDLIAGVQSGVQIAANSSNAVDLRYPCQHRRVARTAISADGDTDEVIAEGVGDDDLARGAVSDPVRPQVEG